MDRKSDQSESLFKKVNELIKKNKIVQLRELLEEYHIIDIVDIMENLNDINKVKLLEALPLDMSASILEQIDAELFKYIIFKLEEEHSKNILEFMSLDDMADILNDMNIDDRQNIMKLLNKEDAASIKELLIYEEESSGGIMTTSYISINKYMTAEEAINYMRDNAKDAETIYYVYVVDNNSKLVGVLSLREIITARKSSIIKDLMSENLIYVYLDEDREEAVKLVSKYNLIAIPVVDSNHILKGIITVDDIIDIIEEEANEDMYKFAGTSEGEIDFIEKNNIDMKTQVTTSIKARTPWLVMMLLISLISAFMVSKLDFIINEEYNLLVFFIPVIIGMGGNIGIQSSTLAIMAISNDNIKFKNALKEGIIGFVIGIICSILISIILYMFVDDSQVICIISAAIFINMIVGAMIGILLPLLLKKLNLDPSLISAPIIATILDITGIIIYFIIIRIWLLKFGM